MTVIRMNLTHALSRKNHPRTMPTPETLFGFVSKLFLISVVIGSLCTPLIIYASYLWKSHTGSVNLISLHWYELAALVLLLLLPLGAMKLLKIAWTARYNPG